ncbi:MAG TPA: hypothetical protein VFO39_21280 [Candidatus Sulfotelmatobacter sp.]|nr:hypothetical protein [Candidatus Sulfotelmatobacter sp.]
MVATIQAVTSAAELPEATQWTLRKAPVLGNPRPRKSAGEAIWLQSLPKPSMFTLAAWGDFAQNQMNDARNPIVGRAKLSVAGEPFVCLERDAEADPASSASANPSPQTSHLPSIECNSAGLLDVMFFTTGTHAQHDYSEFYSLMSSIEKNSQ